MSDSEYQAPLMAVEDLEAGATSWKEGCCGDACGKISTKLAGCKDSIAASAVGRMVLAITPEQKQRAKILVTTLLMLSDQWLDGGVAVSLHNGLFKTISLVLVSSVVVPQVISWGFLWQNNMTDGWGLLRMLIFPILGATALIYFWLAGIPEPGLWHNVALFSMVVSPEPIYNVYKGCVAGKEVDEAFWTGVAEGLIEAPASAALTLYPTMLLSFHSHRGASWFFTLSSVFSLAMITRASTNLHFYGLSDTGLLEYAKTLLVMKLPQVMSQVLGFVFLAFLTRPLPEGIGESTTTEEAFDDEIRNKNLSWLVFVFLFHEVALNFSTLKTVSPGMRSSVAALFATTMVVSSPPGFLQAFDGARLGHAIQHFVGVILMTAVAISMATQAHWDVLTHEYPAFAVMFVVCVPWAFLASIFMHKDVALEHRVKNAQSRFVAALSSHDRLMARLLVDVEGVDVDGFFDKALGEKTYDLLKPMVDLGLVDVEHKFDEAVAKGQSEAVKTLIVVFEVVRECAKSKVDAALRAGDANALRALADSGVGLESSLDLALWESDCETARLLLVAGVRPRPGPLADASDFGTNIDTGRGPGGNKWAGACACDGRVYFCPFDAAEVMVLDPHTGALTFIDTGRGQGGNKWRGACACDGRVYFCPFDAAEVMVLDPSTGALTLIDTGRGRAPRKWVGACACDGRVYFCPFGAAEVMVLDPSTGALTFIDTGRGLGLWHWSGACACDGRVYFCPFSAAEVMVLDPSTGTLTFIDTGGRGRGPGGSMWVGACACDGRVYFCPFSATKVMVLDPSTGALTFIDTGRGPGGDKWGGACACDKWGGACVYFCPCNAAEVMVLDPHTGALTFIDAGKDGNYKWAGEPAACSGRVYFCPCDAAEVLQVAPGVVDRLGRLRELGLQAPASRPSIRRHTSAASTADRPAVSPTGPASRPARRRFTTS